MYDISTPLEQLILEQLLNVQVFVYQIVSPSLLREVLHPLNDTLEGFLKSDLPPGLP
jgi:hypothetical protein